MNPSWFGLGWFPPVVIFIQCGCLMLMMGNFPHNVLFPNSNIMWLLEMIFHRFLGLSCFPLYHKFEQTLMLMVVCVLGILLLVYCNNTVRRMHQLWFWVSCLCPEGFYYSDSSISLSINPSQRTWGDTFLGTSLCLLCRLHAHRLYLIPCGMLCWNLTVQPLIWPLQNFCSMPP